MITLSVYQQGDITYSPALSKQFNPAYITKAKQVSFKADTTSTQFLYCGEIFIVSETYTSVSNSITGVVLGGITEDNILEENVAFRLANIQSVQDIDGYAGIIYALNIDKVGFQTTQLATSTTDTDFATIAQFLPSYGFRRIELDLGNGTTRTMYLNLNAIQTIVGSASTYFQYVLPNGTIYTDTSTSNTYTVDITGIDADDTFTEIVTAAGVIDMGGVQMFSAPERTAIKVLINNYLTSIGAVSGTVAVTAPISTTCRIVIPNCNVAFSIATAIIDTVSTDYTFVQS